MDVIVIGAGWAGCPPPLGWRRAGRGCGCWNKNARVGGKLNVWHKDGFTFDTGPHVLTMRWALGRGVCAAGQAAGGVWSWCRLDTVCRYHFPGGDVLDAPADPDAAARAIARFAPGEEAGFRRFLAYARRVSEATTEPFLRQDFGASVRGMPTPAQWRQLRDFLALKPWRSLRDVVREHFYDPRLRQVFELYALYSGSHPAARLGHLRDGGGRAVAAGDVLRPGRPVPSGRGAAGGGEVAAYRSRQKRR